MTPRQPPFQMTGHRRADPPLSIPRPPASVQQQAFVARPPIAMPRHHCGFCAKARAMMGRLPWRA